MGTKKDFVVKKGLIVTDDITLDDGGSLKEAGGTAALTFDGSGHITKIGQDSPSTSDYLQWDGSKAVWTAVSSGGASALDGLSDAKYNSDGSGSFGYSLLIGHETHASLNNAFYNVGIGNQALDALTSGDSNVAVGRRAGSGINSGSENVLVGRNAGYNITTGSRNIGIGYQTLDAANTENDNIAIGYDAMGVADGGEKNIALGNYALETLTTGGDNIAIGRT